MIISDFIMHTEGNFSVAALYWKIITLKKKKDRLNLESYYWFNVLNAFMYLGGSHLIFTNIL